MNKPIGRIANAQIKSTFLGREDHGIFTAFLYLDYGSSSQGFGGYTLGTLTTEDKHQYNRGQSCKFGIKFLLQVLDVLEVESWERLPGTRLRVDKKDFLELYGIGHYLKDKWLYPKELTEEFFG